MAITVYRKDSCVQCDMTKKKLDSMGVEYTTVDMEKDPEALDFVKSLGHLQAPVVVVTGKQDVILDSWAGFIPSKIASLA